MSRCHGDYITSTLTSHLSASWWSIYRWFITPLITMVMRGIQIVPDKSTTLLSNKIQPHIVVSMLAQLRRWANIDTTIGQHWSNISVSFANTGWFQVVPSISMIIYFLYVTSQSSTDVLSSSNTPPSDFWHTINHGWAIIFKSSTQCRAIFLETRRIY